MFLDVNNTIFYLSLCLLHTDYQRSTRKVTRVQQCVEVVWYSLKWTRYEISAHPTHKLEIQLILVRILILLYTRTLKSNIYGHIISKLHYTTSFQQLVQFFFFFFLEGHKQKRRSWDILRAVIALLLCANYSTWPIQTSWSLCTVTHNKVPKK